MDCLIKISFLNPILYVAIIWVNWELIFLMRIVLAVWANWNMPLLVNKKEVVGVAAVSQVQGESEHLTVLAKLKFIRELLKILTYRVILFALCVIVML